MQCARLEKYKKCALCTCNPAQGGGSLLEIENFFSGEQIGWANLKLKRFCPRKDLLIIFSWICQDAFEIKFMSATESLYAAEGKQLVNELDVPIYLHHAEKRLRVRVMVEFLRRRGGDCSFCNDLFFLFILI